MKFSYLFAMSIILFSCENNEKVDQYSHIPFLHQIKETKKYEVVEIFNSSYPMWDNIGEKYIIVGDTYYKYSINGKFSDSTTNQNVLIINDSYTFSGDYYTDWFNGGNKIKKKFTDILPYQNDRDTILYKSKHLEFYDKSSIVIYTDYGLYYFYYFYKNQWFRLPGGGLNYIKKRYPEKLPSPRLKSIELNPNPPDYVKQFYVPRKKVNSISDAVGAPKDFSLGTYIIRVGLPGGDSLVYRRFGDGLGNLSTFYEKPSSEGGNDSIIFIKQDYHNNKMIDGGTYFSHGGLFMIRPKRKK